MGFYDCRCMLTGVSLKGADSVLVPLQENGGTLSPVGLGIKGSYNRLGSIDMIDEDAGTEALLRFFRERLARREFVVDPDYLPGSTLESTEQLLGLFERNMNDSPRAALLNGKQIVFGLISTSVWQAIVLAQAPTSVKLEDVFGGSLLPQGIYGTTNGTLQAQVRDLACVKDFMASRSVGWTKTEADCQHYDEEMRQFLSEARQTFSDCPPVLEGLLEYEREVEDLLKEEDEEDDE